MVDKTHDLGAQDPELKNSPVAWETDEETDTLLELVPAAGGVCYFNGSAYSHGTLIRSGTSVLRCDGGVWVPEGGD